MKHVVKYPYHLWAHQSYAEFGSEQNHARNASGNRSFRENIAYSYNARIANVLTSPVGTRLYLVTNRAWSVTTSKHRREVLSAIPPCHPVCIVPSIGDSRLSDLEHEGNVRYMWDMIDNRQGLADRARLAGRKAQHITEALHLFDSLRAYILFFGIHEDYPLPTETTRETLASALAGYRALQEEEARVETARQIEQAKEALKKADEAIAQWLEGEPVRIPWMVSEAFLRVMPDNPGTVETSREATVPLEHVRKALPFVLRLINSGGKYNRGEHSIRLGFYTLDRIDSEGTVYVGCHKFLKAEVLRFANLIA